MTKIWRKALFMALISALMLCGCSRPANSTGTEDDNSAVQTSAGETEEETETAKETEEEAEAEAADELDENELYNTYIEINNAMVGRLDDVISSYFECVEFQEEFLPLEEDYWCLSNISTLYTYMDAADEMLEKKQEKDALDQAYAALYPVMRELAETLDKVEEYTDMKSYVDDDYAKGKEYHEIIWKDYNEYEVLGTQFMTELSAVANAQRNEELERLKEEGYEATYGFVKMINTAQEMQAAIYEQVDGDEQLLKLDIEALQPLYDQYVEEVQNCLDFLKDEEAMYEEGYPTKSAAYNMMDRYIKESKTALTELFERVRNQDALDVYELNSMFAADGSITEFDESVSKIIYIYNQMLNY